MKNNRNDLFNGNIRVRYRNMVIFSLIFGPLVMLGCGLIIGVAGLFYEKVEETARILMYVISVVAILDGVSCALLMILFIRIYPKHKKIAFMVSESYVFNDV